MSDEEEHSEREFYYPDELKFQDNSDLTETITNELARAKTKETAKKRLACLLCFCCWCIDLAITRSTGKASV